MVVDIQCNININEVRVFTSPDCNSDHCFVVAKIRTDLENLENLRDKIYNDSEPETIGENNKNISNRSLSSNDNEEA